MLDVISAVVIDHDNKFIDWTSGVLVTNIGHCHPKLVNILNKATAKMLNCYEYPNNTIESYYQ